MQWPMRFPLGVESKSPLIRTGYRNIGHCLGGTGIHGGHDSVYRAFGNGNMDGANGNCVALPQRRMQWPV